MERYRITPDASVYFVTFSVVEWLPIFVTQAPCQIICDSFRYCHIHKQLRINAYVVMPTHMHAIVFDAGWDSTRLNQTLTDFRKFTGRQLVDWCRDHAPACFEATLRADAPNDRTHRFWQPTRHPVGLTSAEFWRQKLDYLHDNPCRKALVRRAADWRFSSAGWYVSDGESACDIPITRLDWT